MERGEVEEIRERGLGRGKQRGLRRDVEGEDIKEGRGK